MSVWKMSIFDWLLTLFHFFEVLLWYIVGEYLTKSCDNSLTPSSN